MGGPVKNPALFGRVDRQLYFFAETHALAGKKKVDELAALRICTDKH